jgi:hypothetical protein
MQVNFEDSHMFRISFCNVCMDLEVWALISCLIFNRAHCCFKPGFASFKPVHYNGYNWNLKLANRVYLDDAGLQMQTACSAEIDAGSEYFGVEPGM